MMDFPASPTTGQRATFGGVTYEWTGYAWKIVVSTGTVTVGVTPPSTPDPGALWFNNDASAGGGVLYIFYNDGNTQQWVPVSPAASGRTVAVPNFLSRGLAKVTNTSLTVRCIGADSNNTAIINLPSMTKNTNAAWTAGNGGGALGTGVTWVAATYYHVFGINLNTGVADWYIDTSVTAANKPAGTAAFRRLGAIRADASALMNDFTQYGDEFRWNGVRGVGFTNPGTAVTLRTVDVPPGIVVEWIGVLELYNNNTTPANVNAAGVAVLPGSTPDLQTSQSGVVAGGTIYGRTGMVRAFTNTSQQINTQVASYSGTDVIFNIRTWGWTDTCGRND